MSDVLYPLGVIESLRVTEIDRTITDEFEAGNTSTRRLWSAQNFKRRFEVAHAPLTFAEFDYLQSFHSQRSGRYDSFWFRDNIHRAGNAKVRFAQPLVKERIPAAYRASLLLEEVAPIRRLPNWDEVQQAAGAAPIFWWDANRERYISHAGTVYTEPQVWDAVAGLCLPAWQGGTSLSLANTAAQYQYFSFAASQWAKTGGNITPLAGSQPACTLFAITQQASAASKQVLFAIGAMGAGNGLGIAISASNNYEPWIGGSESWSGAANSPVSTWRSVAVTWAASSNSATTYLNGSSTAAGSNTRNFTAGPGALGAAIDGTLKLNGSIAHAIAFAAELSQAQVKAVHNLLAYQYGMATVA